MPQRKCLVEGVSYLGADGASHVAHAGETIDLADEGVAHFEWVHDATPEARHAKEAATAEAEKPAPKKVVVAKKADETA